jgi:hypothetical protein
MSGKSFLDKRPHPEERSEAERLEGWQRAPYLLPSFETLRFATLLRMRLKRWREQNELTSLKCRRGGFPTSGSVRWT